MRNVIYHRVFSFSVRYVRRASEVSGKVILDIDKISTVFFVTTKCRLILTNYVTERGLPK